MRCSERPTLLTLPDDIWLKIAAHLSCGERANLAAAARKFRYAADHGDLKFKANFFSGEDDEEGTARIRSFARSGSPGCIGLCLESDISALGTRVTFTPEGGGWGFLQAWYFVSVQSWKDSSIQRVPECSVKVPRNFTANHVLSPPMLPALHSAFRRFTVYRLTHTGR